MYNIRPISSDDLDQVKKLYMSHRRLQRGKYNFDHQAIDNWIDTGLVIVGAFENEKLIAFMTYKLLTQLPISRIGNIYINPGSKNLYNFKDDTHPIPKILDYILEITESFGYYTWMYSRANINTYDKLEDKKQDLLRCCKYGYDNEKQQYRYEKYIEEIIQPFAMSEFDSHNKMFSLGKYEREIIIFKCCLKAEYRTWNI
jgi:hypothetical protein